MSYGIYRAYASNESKRHEQLEGRWIQIFCPAFCVSLNTSSIIVCQAGWFYKFILIFYYFII